MSLPSSASDEPMICEDIFSLNGLNYTTFYLGAAHGLHSLSLEEIRYFFDKNATEDNKIPTVNIDFRSEEVLHFNAPLWGYEDKFDTWSLKIMDWFMLNDQPHIYETVNYIKCKMQQFSFWCFIQGSTTLQKIGHQFHMQELYGRTAEVYQELKLNPPSESVCRCANDVNANGILPELATISNALKYRARLGDTAESKDVDANENAR